MDINKGNILVLDVEKIMGPQDPNDKSSVVLIEIDNSDVVDYDVDTDDYIDSDSDIDSDNDDEYIKKLSFISKSLYRKSANSQSVPVLIKK